MTDLGLQVNGQIYSVIAKFPSGLPGDQVSKVTYDGEFRFPLLLAQGSPFFHLSCQGELGGNCSQVTKGHCHPRASSAKTRGFHTQLEEGPETP